MWSNCQVELVELYVGDGLEMAGSSAVTLGERIYMVIVWVSWDTVLLTLVELYLGYSLEMVGCSVIAFRRDCPVTVRVLLDTGLLVLVELYLGDGFEMSGYLVATLGGKTLCSLLRSFRTELFELVSCTWWKIILKWQAHSLLRFSGTQSSVSH